MNQAQFLTLFSHPEHPDNVRIAFFRFCSTYLKSSHPMLVFDGFQYVKVTDNPIDFFKLEGLEEYRDMFTTMEDGKSWDMDEQTYIDHLVHYLDAYL